MRRHTVLIVMLFAATPTFGQEVPFVPPVHGPFDSEFWNNQRQNDTEFWNAQRQENPELRDYLHQQQERLSPAQINTQLESEIGQGLSIPTGGAEAMERAARYQHEIGQQLRNNEGLGMLGAAAVQLIKREIAPTKAEATIDAPIDPPSAPPPPETPPNTSSLERFDQWQNEHGGVDHDVSDKFPVR